MLIKHNSDNEWIPRINSLHMKNVFQMSKITIFYKILDSIYEKNDSKHKIKLLLSLDHL